RAAHSGGQPRSQPLSLLLHELELFPPTRLQFLHPAADVAKFVSVPDVPRHREDALLLLLNVPFDDLPQYLDFGRPGLVSGLEIADLLDEHVNDAVLLDGLEYQVSGRRILAELWIQVGLLELLMQLERLFHFREQPPRRGAVFLD